MHKAQPLGLVYQNPSMADWVKSTIETTHAWLERSITVPATETPTLFTQAHETVLVLNAIMELVREGANTIVIANPAWNTLLPALRREVTVPLVGIHDQNPELLRLAIEHATPTRHPFRVGMIGGLGPAATVDLYDKITKATPAKKDQEHIKLVVDQNPQIPDRTACLLHGGEDPTPAMFGCAKRLEAAGCHCLIVPCNTAHNFIAPMQSLVNIPFVSMIEATMEEIAAKLGSNARIGLMATTGTIQSGIYKREADRAGLPLFTPDDEHKALVMDAIYGEKGAKAGFTTGLCHDELIKAAQYLVAKHDCNCLILGCTELPLILHESDAFEVAGKTVTVIDPTSALARKIVKMAQAYNATL